MFLKLSEQVRQDACTMLTPVDPDNIDRWWEGESGERALNNRIEGRMIQRIHIIGGPASGKSTLARWIGPSLGIPVYDLDKIAFEGLEFAERPISARLADVNSILNQPNWITEGIFLGWTEGLLQSADVIVWLDYIGWPRAAWRIIKRFLQGGVEEAKRQPGVRKFTRVQDYTRHVRLIVAVLFTSRIYYNSRGPGVPKGARMESRVTTAQHLAPYRDKVVRCSSVGDVERFGVRVLSKVGAATDLNCGALFGRRPGA